MRECGFRSDYMGWSDVCSCLFSLWCKCELATARAIDSQYWKCLYMHCLLPYGSCNLLKSMLSFISSKCGIMLFKSWTQSQVQDLWKTLLHKCISLHITLVDSYIPSHTHCELLNWESIVCLGPLWVALKMSRQRPMYLCWKMHTTKQKVWDLFISVQPSRLLLPL